MSRYWSDERREEEAAADEDEFWEEDDEFEGQWELDPNDPTHPDFDLSESAGYAEWEPEPKPWLLRRGMVLLLTALVLFGLIMPLLARLS